MEKEKIDRINYLAKKKKTTGLSNEEQLEQKNLYKDYLGLMKSNMKVQLDNMVIDKPDGTSVELKNLKKKKI